MRPQPVGEPLEWSPARRPARTPLRGTHVLLRPIDSAADTEPLYAVSHPPVGDAAIWTYLFYGPFESIEELRSLLVSVEHSEDPLYFAIVRTPEGRPEGMASYMRIEPEQGVVEIGNIWFGTPLQRTASATEAIYLLARHAFDELGYRRLEWKCDSLNAPSRRAAERFGFVFEGVFEQHIIYKGRNRDTAWYAITDKRWPSVRAGFEAWLAPSNFDSEGCQRRSLRALIRPEA
ncbi:MAG: GNAT family N-acetyltransferase [Actinomycetota bacterium]|nr:GNAT family N-acetyltransferase [Actinomycetota bacterium]